MGTGSELPPNSSDVSPRAHHFRRGPTGESAATDAPPCGPQPSLSLTWLRAQPRPKEGSGRSSSQPCGFLPPSSRAPVAPLVAPQPDGASLSASGPGTGIK